MHEANSHKKTLPSDLSAPWVVDRTRTRALLVAGAFGVGSIIAAVLNLDEFLRAYVLGYMLWTGISVGCLALLMVQHLSGGKWGLIVRRLLEASTRNFWILAILFIPIVLGRHHLYAWSNDPITLPEAVRKYVLLKGWWLNTTGFIIRAVIYFVCWIGFAWKLNSMSTQRDQEPTSTQPRWTIRFENVSGVGLVVYALTITFASIDWVMSMDATWFSTIYGLLFLAGQGLSSLSVVIITLIMLSKENPMRELLRKTELHDLGKLLLAFVMLYAYLGFSQFLIIWSGNLAEEIPWYIDRLRGGWQYVGILVVLSHFVLPFALLLSRDLKKNPGKITAVALWILFARGVDLYWLIEPNYKVAGKIQINFHFAYLVVPLAMGGIWVWGFMTELKKRPLIPINDPQLEELLELEHAAV